MKVLEVLDINISLVLQKKHPIPGLGWYVQSSTPQQPTLLQTRLTSVGLVSSIYYILHQSGSDFRTVDTL
jgi:hypothetical protein